VAGNDVVMESNDAWVMRWRVVCGRSEGIGASDDGLQYPSFERACRASEAALLALLSYFERILKNGLSVMTNLPMDFPDSQ
jgi:hypothetical protein